MKFKFTSYLFILLISGILNSQENQLCSLEYSKIKGNNKNLSARIIPQSEAYNYVKKLMTMARLPMNFQVETCLDKSCENNAQARMDNNGTRYIVYDDKFFDKLSQETDIGIIAFFAHEIGHHLSAHTLNLNFKTFKNAVKKCSKKSRQFDKKICDSLYTKDYKNYLQKSRLNELHADRFAGYLMNIYGADLVDVKEEWKKISGEYDDSFSTHPSLSKRIKAIEYGYGIAEKHKLNDSPINLREIKNAPLEFLVSKTEKDLIEMQKLLIDIGDAFDIFSPGKIESNVPLYWYRIRTVQSIPDLGPVYNNKEQNFYKVLTEKSDEFFGLNTVGFKMNRKPEINFTAHFGIHIEKGLLKILLFEKENQEIIYKSSFNRNEISFKEINSLVLEIIDNGLRNSIRDYEKKEENKL